jgi:hypothetical protein
MSREHDEMGMSGTPTRKCCGPLAHAIERVDPVAARDGAAIDDARHDGRQLACGCRYHRFVHQGEPGVESALHEQHAPLQVSTERNEVRLAEAVPDFSCAGGSIVRFD